MKVSNNRTKIVATLGPASAKKDVLLSMIKAGVNVCRLNFSHGKAQDHQKSIDIIREINGRQIGSTADMQAIINAGARGWRVTIQRHGQLITAQFG